MEYAFYSDQTNISCNGNIEVLLDYKTVEAGEHPPMDNYCFGNFFEYLHIVKAPKLPATELTEGCYLKMFVRSNITTAPNLPATVMKPYCYTMMFHSCEKLSKPMDILPATELAKSCYYAMFTGCTALTTTPKLPATNMVNGCYNCMFSECTNLLIAPTLPATTLAPYCYHYMFENCKKLTTLPALPATFLPDSCYAYMFSGCFFTFKNVATDTYPNAYRVPSEGSIVYKHEYAIDDMFDKVWMADDIGSPFELETTYYTKLSVV
jgi:hypothetical protein